VRCVKHPLKFGRSNWRIGWHAVVCCALSWAIVQAQGAKPAFTDPEVLSMFPLAGQQGQVWEAEIRGHGLEGAYGVWSDCNELQAAVKRVETIDPKPSKPASPQDKKTALQRVWLEMRAAPGALAGTHKLRLLGSRGISNIFLLHVEREPVLLEDASLSSSPLTAQPLRFPAVVSGKIAEEGEVDYFALQAGAGSQLSFEVDSGGPDFDPVITLYEPAGSWFDPQRLRRLDYNDDGSPRAAAAASLNVQFRGAGRYLLAVAAFVGLGKPDFSYRLRVAEGQLPEEKKTPEGKSAHAQPVQWREREFARRIEPDRLKKLWSRGVRAAKPFGTSSATPADDTVAGAPSHKSAGHSFDAMVDGSGIEELRAAGEVEPNDLPGAALELAIPAIVEGTVGSPGDVDHYRIRVLTGQALAFEIQTLREMPPRFSPHLEALDAKGEQVFNNVYQRIGGDGDDWVQSLESKCIYTFERGGDYLLRVRDLTSRSGSPKFAYRLLVRPQVPHAGDIDIREERFNLVPGQAKKLTVNTAQEEGFDGQVAVTVHNLPPGVVVLPASDAPPAEGPPFAKVHPERFVARSHSLVLMLHAESGAPPTTEPVWAQVKILPIVGGKPGDWIPVSQIPVVVLKGPLPERLAHGQNRER
jgi:hypothetical protein